MSKRLSKAQKEILSIINKNNGVTTAELACLTGYARSGISTRVSELRKKGYDIKTKPKEVQAYFLIHQHENKIDYSYASEQIIHYVTENNLFGHVLDYPTLSRRLNLSMKEIIGGIILLFKQYNVMQMSNEKVIIKR